MKKSYHFDNINTSSVFTGTYRKFDNLQHSRVCGLKEEKCYRTLNSELSKKYSQTPRKLNSFIKIVTQFFLVKEEFYTNGSKNCTDEFLFDNKF